MEKHSVPLIEKLAAWTAARPASHTPVAIDHATRSIEDVVACMFAGADSREAALVRQACAGWQSEGAATLVGRPERASPLNAALINGTAAHALDYDDTFLLGANHASAVLVPALFSLAEGEDCTGAALIDAYSIGLQVQYFLALGCMRSHGDLGWHSTATLGAIGAAAACARLMRLDERQTAAAISLGVSMIAGMKVQFGTDAKPLHAGLAAQHAIQAATLARAGMAGSLSALDGAMGFLELCGGPRAAGWADIDRHLAQPALAIETEGLMVKRHPCCAATHRVLDCAQGLLAEHAFGPADIESIDVHIGYGHFRNLMYPQPATHVQARFSMPYCLAAVLHRPEGLGLRDFTPEALARPAVQALMPRIRVHAYAPEDSHQPHRVAIHCTDGRRIEGTRDYADGTIHYPLTQDQRTRKFDDCCHALPEARRSALLGQLRRLHDVESCQALLALMRPDPGPLPS